MSNSFFLKNIIQDETSELREGIISFMESKVNEFSALMKSNIENVITQKLDNFYKKKFDDHDSILFDTDGTDIVQKTLSWLQTIMSNGYQNPTGVQALKKQMDELNKNVRTHGYKCFVISCCYYTGNGNDGNSIYIFKKFSLS